MFERIYVSDFDEVFSIMEKSFPFDEYRPYEEQKELFENEYYRVYVSKEEHIKGFISVWDFPEFLYVEHFAVSPEFRNMGIGKEILEELKAHFNKTVCLEVEPPENELTKRRIGFYMRNGFFINEYPYTQPPISKGKNPVPLMIMSSGKSLSESEFHIIKETLYREVYKTEM